MKKRTPVPPGLELYDQKGLNHGQSHEQNMKFGEKEKNLLGNKMFVYGLYIILTMSINMPEQQERNALRMSKDPFSNHLTTKECRPFYRKHFGLSNIGLTSISFRRNLDYDLWSLLPTC